MLLVDYSNDGKEDDEKRREGQGLFESMSEFVLFDNAIKRGQ